jgi:hypothetical protein
MSRLTVLDSHPRPGTDLRHRWPTGGANVIKIDVLLEDAGVIAMLCPLPRRPFSAGFNRRRALKAIAGKLRRLTSRFKAFAVLQAEAGTSRNPPGMEIEDEVCVDSPR